MVGLAGAAFPGAEQCRVQPSCYLRDPTRVVRDPRRRAADATEATLLRVSRSQAALPHWSLFLTLVLCPFACASRAGRERRRRVPA
jgi:hypothetical protein